MKKLFFIFLLLSIIFFNEKTFAAANFLPQYTNSINHFGIGALRIKNNVVIYEKPDTNSKIIQQIYWDNTGAFYTSAKKASKKPSEIFLAYVPRENMAFFSTEDEDENWIKICYDQKNLLFGWVKKEDGIRASKFYSYKELFFKFGKEYGVYTFKNLPSNFKTLHSSPDKNSKIVDEFDVAKFISPWLIQGNWMLAKVTGMDNETKTGWLRWRSDEGKLYVFIDLNNHLSF